MSGSTAIVTGGARGIGYAVVRRLAADGWNVAMCDLSQTIAEREAELDAIEGSVFVHPCDVSDEESVKYFVAQVIREFGSVDALVNNAGVGGALTYVTETTIEDFKKVLDVNVTGTFLMCKHVAPYIGLEKNGRIVNFGSIYGIQGVAGGAGYCASKGAIAALTHSLALELAPKITVNTIAPGPIISDMYLEDQQFIADENGRTIDEQLELSRLKIPAGRQGQGSDIAGAIAWLLSADADYVTGQTLSINGGVLFN